MKSNISLLMTTLTIFLIFSSNSFAEMGKWSKSVTTRGNSQTCTHVTRNSGWNNTAVLSAKFTPSKCVPNNSPVEPNCIGDFGQVQPKIVINNGNPNAKVKTQIITSNDLLKLARPNFPISMIFNSTLKRGQTKTFSKMVSLPGSQFACRIGI